MLTSAAPVDTTQGQASSAPEYQLDEMIQYKLQDYFGETYKDTDTIKRQQVEYIFKQVSAQLGTTDYGQVVAQCSNLERMIGLNGAPDRLYRLYQWLKLDNTRRSIDAEMGALSG